MAGKTKSALEAEVVDLLAQVATANTQISSLTSANARLTADNTALVGNVEALTRSQSDLTNRLKLLESSVDVATDGHINAGRQYDELNAQVNALRTAFKALEAQGQAQQREARTWAQRSAPRTGTASGTTTASQAPPPTTNTTQRGQQRAPHQPRQHQHQPSDTVTGKFMVFADAKVPPNEVQEMIAHYLGYSTSSIQSVQKLMSPAAAASVAAAAAAATAAEAATAAAAAAAAAPSTSAAPASATPNAPSAPAPTPPRVVNVPFVITTTKHIADQAVKGNLRQLLQEQQIKMYVDDYLTREEQQERKRREPERLQLKADGLKVAWHGTTLVKRVAVDGNKGAWVVVPAPPPQDAAEIPATAST
jgi:peptidoglycan hydrolase CwlO-like protein